MASAELSEPAYHTNFGFNFAGSSFLQSSEYAVASCMLLHILHQDFVTHIVIVKPSLTTTLFRIQLLWPTKGIFCDREVILQQMQMLAKLDDGTRCTAPLRLPSPTPSTCVEHHIVALYRASISQAQIVFYLHLPLSAHLEFQVRFTNQRRSDPRSR